MLEIVQAESAPEFPLEGVAAILAGIPHRAEGYDDVLRLLRLCQRLDQLQLWVRDGHLVGILSWLRACSVHVRGSVDDFLLLEDHELRHGPCVLIVEILVLSPGLAYAAVREMTTWPGVEKVCGWRRGRFATLRGRHGTPERDPQ